MFCGVGGMTNGFIEEGLDVVAGLDIDPSCRYAYEKNNGSQFIQADIQNITGESIISLYPKDGLKILIGCAPCQPFSIYNRKKKNSKYKDLKWKLIDQFLRVIRETNPDVVSMENVPKLIKTRIFGRFIKGLEAEGYHVSSSIVYCPNYGIPQKRRRLVLLASRLGEIKLVEPTHTADIYPTTKDAIGGLPPVKCGEVCPTDPLHRSRVLGELNLKRIKATPAGGDWRDWPDRLVLKCHKKKKGKSFGRVYGRMRWDTLAPTMTAQCTGIGNGPFGHPDQNRAITFREAALIQTFPINYDFIDPEGEFKAKDITRHIGNAVPPRLGQMIARSIKEHLEGLDER